MKPKLIFVTGATGFVGAEVARVLSDHLCYKVVALYRSESKREHFISVYPNLKKKIAWVQGSLECLTTLPKNIHTVIHAAADRNTIPSNTVENVMRSNVMGLSNLLKCSVRVQVKQFLYISSQSVYGHAKPPWCETDTVQPEGLYALTKYMGETLVQSYGDVLPYVIVRPSRVYGVGVFMRWHELISQYVSKVVRSDPLTLHGSGKQRIDLLHIEDLVAGIKKVLDQPFRNSTFNFGMGESYTIHELMNCISSVGQTKGYPASDIIVETETRPTGPKHLELSIEKAKKYLNWQPNVSLSKGVEMYFDAYSNITY